MRMYGSYQNMIERMKETWQVPNVQTVYEHCESVRDKSLELYDHIVSGKSLTSEWVLPSWIEEYRKVLTKELRITPRPVVERYTQYHDCGKPLVAEFKNGKMHFSGHEYYSAYVYNSFLGKDRQVLRLIKNDMLIHKSKACDVGKLLALRERATLLIVSLAEVHANAELFGGVKSDSFKIKYKKIVARGNALFKAIKEQK